MAGDGASKKRDRESARDAATGFEVAVPVEPRRMTAYQAFQKMEQGPVRERHPDLASSEIMSKVAEAWNATVGKRRAPYEEAAAKAHAEQLDLWTSQAADREAARKAACATLGVSPTTSWEELVAEARRRNGDGDVASSSSASKRAKVEESRVKAPPSAKAKAAGPKRGGAAVDERSFVRGTVPKLVRKEPNVLAAKSRNWRTCWNAGPRRKAVLMGLDALFALANESANFDTFGNDAIQCFYDVANVTPDPVRARALMYVEQLAQRWRHSMLRRGWLARGAAPTPQNVLDAIIGVYCMERAGVSSAKLRADVRAALLVDDESASPGSSSSPPGPPRAGTKPHYTVSDYIGFDPATAAEVPAACPELLTGEAASPFRTLCNALIYSFYADRVGLSIGADYGACLRHLDALRPYKGPNDLEWSDYTDECYLVTHVVFTLNNWGELALDPELLPHEYCFIREHLPVAVRERDAHLVGEFLECLRAFGATDADPLVQLAISFLLSTQDAATARWDPQADNYTSYHATMVATQAMLCHSFRGSGPGLASAVPVLLEWHAKDCVPPPPPPSPPPPPIKAPKPERKAPPPSELTPENKPPPPLSPPPPAASSEKKPTPTGGGGAPSTFTAAAATTKDKKAASASAASASKAPKGPTTASSSSKAAQQEHKPPMAAAAVAPTAAAAAAAAAAKSSPSASEVSETANARLATRLATATAVADIEGKLAAAVEASEWPVASRLLRELSALPIDFTLLQATTIGKTVAMLKKANDHKLKATAKALVAKWKQLVRDADDATPAPAAIVPPPGEVPATAANVPVPPATTPAPLPPPATDQPPPPAPNPAPMDVEDPGGPPAAPPAPAPC